MRGSQIAWMLVAVAGVAGAFYLFRPKPSAAPDRCSPALEEAVKLEQAGEPRSALTKQRLALTFCTGPDLERAKALETRLQRAIAELESCDKVKRDAEALVGEGRLRLAEKQINGQSTGCATRGDIVAILQSAKEARKSSIDRTDQARTEVDEGRFESADALVGEAERLDRENPDLPKTRRYVAAKRAVIKASPEPQPPAPTPAPTPTPTQTQPLPALPPNSDTIVQMLQASLAGDWARVDGLGSSLRGSVLTTRGDRPSARKANDEGLAARDPSAALDAFRRGVAADPSDVEIVNNLGYAQGRVGQIKEAVVTLFTVISMAPDRTPAWANLSEAYAVNGSESSATAAMRIALRYSSDRQRSLTYLTSVSETHQNALFVRVIRNVIADVASIPRSPNDRSTVPAPAPVTSMPSPSSVLQPAPVVPATDEKRIVCETLVRSGLRALNELAYDQAVQQADDAMAAMPGCPGALQLKRDAQLKKDAARRSFSIK